MHPQGSTSEYEFLILILSPNKTKPRYKYMRWSIDTDPFKVRYAEPSLVKKQVFNEYDSFTISVKRLYMNNDTCIIIFQWYMYFP